MEVNINLATKIGLKESLIIEYINRLQKNQNIFFEGEYWAEISLLSFQKEFPFFNETEVRRILVKLEEKKYIKSFRFNTIRTAKRYRVIKEI